MLECVPVPTIQLILMVSLRAYGTVLARKYCRMVNNSDSPPHMFATLSKQTLENLLGELGWVGGRSELELHVGEKTLLAAHIMGRRNQGHSAKKEERQKSGEKIWVSERLPGGGRYRNQTHHRRTNRILL